MRKVNRVFLFLANIIYYLLDLINNIFENSEEKIKV